MNRKRTLSTLLLAAIPSAMACSGAVDQPGDETSVGDGREPAGQVATSEEALTGVVQTNACTATEQRSAELAVEAGRFVAVSTGFAECLALSITSTVTLLHATSTVSAGPYVPQSGDPFGSSDAVTKTNGALYAAQSTGNVALTCGGSGEPGTLGNAAIGSWNAARTSPETMNARPGWGPFAAMDTLGKGSTAEFYQSPRGAIAGTIWHEAMHQWGYRHPGGDWQPSFEKTLPYIVGDCMETVIARSATCTLDCNTAATGRRPVMRSTSNNCECVDDPQFDVGVMLDPGQSCPASAGRTSWPQVELYMDDEDTNNADWTVGWIGQNVSNGNTRFRFCTVPGLGFKQTLVSSPSSTGPQNYAVARMGANCPPGSLPMSRYFDNEDSSNNNSSVGHVSPHEYSGNTRLQLCIFNEATGGSNAATTPFPDLGLRYGVFAGANIRGAITTGVIGTDDEDSSNNDSLGGSSQGSFAFLDTSGNNTLLRLARVR